MTVATGSGSLHFVVDASLLFQLGEELVTKRSVALAELIKNAYDADATRVVVALKRVKAPGGEIVITDNGSGMTFKRVESAWMRIATTRKVGEPSSRKYHRARTGAKGIGRFAARRLAGSLSLRTVARSPSPGQGRQLEETTVEFNWDNFKPGQQVQSVPVEYTRRTLSGEHLPSSGTELRLMRVRDSWTEDDLRALLSDLSRLVTPDTLRRKNPRREKARKSDPGFEIRIEAPEFPELSGDVREQTLAGALAILEGKVAADGTARYTVRFREPKRTVRFQSKTKFAHVGPARFQIHFFVYKKDFFAGLGINVRDAARRGREEGGVHLCIDRFRVAPFGDPGDDWLKLDEDRGRRLVGAPTDLARLARSVERPMLFLPGNNQLFGRVSLSRRANPDIRQTLNREGVIDTIAFRELRAFVRKGIDYLTIVYARQYEEQRKVAKEKREEVDDPGTLIARAREEFVAASESMPPEQRTQVLQAIDLASQTVESQREDFISELSMLRVLASTGTMVVVFQHQLLGTLSGLRQSHKELSDLVSRLPVSERQQFVAELSRLETWIDSAHHQGELLGLLISRKSRTHRKRIALRPVVSSMDRAFSGYMNDYGIKLQNQVDAALRTPPMFEAELSALLVNLLTNAFKAVREQPTRIVEVRASQAKKSITIQVSDTGTGAARDHWENFFRPFVGESEPDPILGEGTGLGLKIVRDFAEVYGGSAQFVAPISPWRTTVEIRLPDE